MFRPVLIRTKLFSARGGYIPSRSSGHSLGSSSRISRKHWGERQRTIAVVCYSSHDTRGNRMESVVHPAAKPPRIRLRIATRRLA